MNIRKTLGLTLAGLALVATLGCASKPIKPKTDFFKLRSQAASNLVAQGVKVDENLRCSRGWKGQQESEKAVYDKTFSRIGETPIDESHDLSTYVLTESGNVYSISRIHTFRGQSALRELNCFQAYAPTRVELTKITPEEYKIRFNKK